MRHLIATAIVLASGLAAPALAGQTHRVEIVSDYDNLRFQFEPRSIRIQPGDTVVWVNAIAEEHNVMVYPGGFPQGASAFQSPYLTEAGEEFAVTFDIEGTYQYHCMPHLLMGMRGEIIVGRHSELSEFHQPTRAEIMTYRSQLLEWFDEDDNLFQVRVMEKGGNAQSHAH